MSEHTPKFRWYPNTFRTYDKADGGQVEGTLYVEYTESSVNVVADTTAELNRLRSLIAAAPDLLAACEHTGPSILHNAGSILIEFAKGHHNEETLRGIGESLRAKADLERSAIAAATGAESEVRDE